MWENTIDRFWILEFLKEWRTIVYTLFTQAKTPRLHDSDSMALILPNL